MVFKLTSQLKAEKKEDKPVSPGPAKFKLTSQLKAEKEKAPAKQLLTPKKKEVPSFWRDPIDAIAYAFNEAKNTDVKELQMTPQEQAQRLITSGLAAKPGEKAGAKNIPSIIQRQVADVLSLAPDEMEQLAPYKSTGSTVGDIATRGAGFVGGLAINPGGGISPANALFQAGRKTANAALLTSQAAKLMSKAPAVVQKVAPIAVKGGHSFGTYEAGRALANNEPLPDVAKDYLEGFAAGAILEPAGAAIAPAAKLITKKAIVPALEKTGLVRPKADALDMWGEVNKAYARGKESGVKVERKAPILTPDPLKPTANKNVLPTQDMVLKTKMADNKQTPVPKIEKNPAEIKREEISSSGNTTTEIIDPSELTYREDMQNRLDSVRNRFMGDDYAPIVVIRYGDNRVILDGHNRATIAAERGHKIKAVTINSDQYDMLKNLGYDDMEISYAALTAGGEIDTAMSYVDQFSGSNIFERGEKAYLKLEEARGKAINKVEPEQVEKLMRKAPMLTQEPLKSTSDTNVLPKVETPIVAKTGQPTTITDPSKVQEIKNSIAEGELILSTGKINGRKMSADELGMVRRSVDSSKAKIGEPETPKGELLQGEPPIKSAFTDKEKQFVDMVNNGGSSIEAVEKQLQQKYNDIINEHVAYLQESGGKGVQQGSLIRDELGEVVGRTGRVSNNPRWYRDFYTETGHKPTKAELRELAIKHLEEGHPDDTGDIPAHDEFSKLEAALNGVKQIKSKLAEALPEGTRLEPNERIGKSSSKSAESAAARIESDSASIQEKVTPETPPKKGRLIFKPGEKERGFSENIRTDAAMPEPIRQSFEESPDTYAQLGNKTVLKKAQGILDENGYDRAKSILYQEMNQYKPENVVLSRLLAKEAHKMGRVQEGREILSDMAVKLTEAGQFSQSAKILREADPMATLTTLDKILKKLNKEGHEKYSDKWNDIDLTPDELTKLGQIETGDEKAIEGFMEKLYTRIYDQMPATGLEKFDAWRKMAMLLNPTTHIRNILGNASMLGLRNSAQKLSAALQKFIPESQRTQALRASEKSVDIAKRIYEQNKKELTYGTNKWEETSGMLQSYDKRVFKQGLISKQAAKVLPEGKAKDIADKGFLEALREFSFKTLEGEDVPFLKNAYINRLSSNIEAKGIKSITDVTPEMLELAKQEALQSTYKDFSLFASFINKAKQSSGITHVVIESQLPFVKTPINLIKRGVQYSPANIIKVIRQIKNKESAGAIIDELAKGMTGTAVMGLGIILASMGVLTGDRPKNKRQAEFEAETGNAPLSVLGKYTYDWAQPAAIPLIVGVEIYRRFNEKDESLAQSLVSAIASGGDSVFNLSLFQNIAAWFKYDRSIAEGFAQVPKDYVTQAIPTLLSKTAKTIDPTQREVTYNQDYLVDTKRLIQSKIPGLSKGLQPRVDTWGREKSYPKNTFTRLFGQYLSPGIINTAKPSEVDKELGRIFEATHDNDVFPKIAPKEITDQKKPYLLTYEDTPKFQKIMGQNSLIKVREFMDSPGYKNLTDVAKVKRILKIYENAREIAKKDFLNKPKEQQVNVIMKPEPPKPKEENLEGAVKQAPKTSRPELLQKSQGTNSTNTAKKPLYGRGNIDLNNRPVIKNPDGSISTVFSMTFGPDEKGQYVLVPGVRTGLNRQMSSQEAWQWYQKSGEYLGKFKSETEADKYAKQLHENQSNAYTQK